MRLRVLQIAMGSIFGLLGVIGLIASIANGALIPIAILPLIVAAIAVGVFELQIRKLEEKGRGVKANIEDIARQVFDAPAAIRPGYDMTVTSGATMGAAMAGMETDVGYTADGTCQGVRTSIASHASTLGRQLGELSHVYSYVAVDLRGLETRFRLSREGVGSTIARAAGVAEDVKVGDAGFDATWNVDCHPDLAREVLDDSIRARIMELQSKVGYVSQDLGVGTMSFVVTKHGLAIRWPGDIQPPLAAFMRDLLLDMRTKILAHEDRKAAQGAERPGYRVAADPIPESLPEPEEAEAKRMRSSS